MAGSSRRVISEPIWRGVPLIPLHRKVGFIHFGDLCRESWKERAIDHTIEVKAFLIYLSSSACAHSGISEACTIASALPPFRIGPSLNNQPAAERVIRY
jgi:hypothetical protein